MQLSLDVGAREGATVVTAEGEIDLGSAPRLRDLVLARLQGGDRQLVLDLAGVAFVDSVGLGLLVASLKRARSMGGDLALVVTTEGVRRPLELTGLTGPMAFVIGRSVDDAVAALAARRAPA